jgi:CheY-like chemotaxis protein
VAAINWEKALKMAVAEPRPDLILLDIMMPGMDGFEVRSRLKSDPETRDIPVIFLSAHDDTANTVKEFTTGAVDYISKPFQPQEVHLRVNTHLTMSRFKSSLAEKTRNYGRSALSYIYSESGVFERDIVLPQNPDCVLVDTILVSGVGDALATYWEADTCAKNCKPNALTGACPPTLSSSCAGSTLLCHIDGIRPSSEAGCGK